MTGHRGSLGTVLERLIFPETSRKLETYFQDSPDAPHLLTRLRQVAPDPGWLIAFGVIFVLAEGLLRYL